MEAFALETVRRLRDDIEAWGAAHPDFFPSFDPLPRDPAAPEVIGLMLEAAAAAGVGPMAAVAGAIARLTGEAILREFGVREIIVENGGDLWMRFETPVDIAVCAGDSPLSGKIGVTLPPELSPCGVCTSSGTVGPSLSFGTADAAMVVCRDAALADAWATATGNMVGTASDIESALAVTSCAPGVISVMIVKDDRMGLRGELPLRLFARQPESGLPSEGGPHSEGGRKKE